MTTITLTAGLVLISLIAPLPVSLFVESLRKRPAPPSALEWDRRPTIRYTDIDGMRIRYIKTGEGPPLVLLHTLRTQLDIFQKLVPRLTSRFTVYAFDYPGHGWSDIPDTDYVPDLFVRVFGGFLARMELQAVLAVGVSIGGTIPLLLAAQDDSRLRAVVSINPYDYAKGGGVRRANAVARVIGTTALIPVLGETFMRLRAPFVEAMIMKGGVANADALPPRFVSELWQVGTRTGHYRAFLNLLRHASAWDDAHSVYRRIRIPVLLLYGEQDWSRSSERESTRQGIPHSQMETIADGGHFLVLDQADEVAARINSFADNLTGLADTGE